MAIATVPKGEFRGAQNAKTGGMACAEAGRALGLLHRLGPDGAGVDEHAETGGKLGGILGGSATAEAGRALGLLHGRLGPDGAGVDEHAEARGMETAEAGRALVGVAAWAAWT